MYIMYVDESGDPGPIAKSPSRYFILSGLVVHELRWMETLNALVTFRRSVRHAYGLKMRDEIHAAEFVRHPSGMTVPKWQRLQLLGDTLTNIASLPDISIINVKVDKAACKADADVFGIAWQTLIQRFDNTVAAKNFPGPKNPTERGIIVADRTDEIRLRGIIRKMRRFNIVPGMGQLPSRALPTVRIIKDPILRDSNHSYFLQSVDVVAYFLHQKFAPNAFVKKKGARNFFDRLKPVLCLKATGKDPLGIVHR